MKTKPGEYTHW